MRTPARLLSLIFGLLGAGASAHPGWGIGVDGQGRVVVCDAVRSVIWRFEPSGRVLPLSDATHAHWIHVSDEGDVTAEHLRYDSNAATFHHSLRRISSTGSIRTLVGESDAGVGFAATSFAVARDGAIVFAPEREPGEVRLLLPDGRSERLARIDVHPKPGMEDHGEGPPAGVISAMVFAPDGTLFLNAGNAIHAVAADGSSRVVATAPPAGPPEVDAPPMEAGTLWGLAVSDAGIVYAAEPRHRRLLALDPGAVAMREVYRSEPPWFVTGVAVRGEVVHVLEHGLEGGDRNLGPRVRVLGDDGVARTIGRID